MARILQNLLKKYFKIGVKYLMERDCQVQKWKVIQKSKVKVMNAYNKW